MSSKAYRFLIIYVPIVLLLSVLTMTTVNPFVFPLPRLRLVNMLPMLGFTVLFVGTILGAAILHMMDQRQLLKPFIGIGLVFTIGVSIFISNVFRPQIVRTVGHRRGAAQARQVAADKSAYEPLAYSAKRHGGHFAYFLHRDTYTDMLEAAVYEGYRHVFETQHADLYDEEALKKKGYSDGFQHGRAAGSNARIRGESADSASIADSVMKKLKMRHMPAYIEGYRQGYPQGFQAAYTAQ